MKPRLLILTRYERDGASSRLRFLQYIPLLESMGWNITVNPLFSPNYISSLYKNEKKSYFSIMANYFRRSLDLCQSSRYDAIWIEKELFPFIPFFIENIFSYKTPWVIDFDDAWFLRYNCHSRNLIRILLHNKLESLVKKATLVIAGNHFLENWAQLAGAPRTAVIPTVIDLNRYPVAPYQTSSFTVGWIGTPMTAHYLETIQEVLRIVCPQGGSSRLLAIGVPNLNISGVEIDARPWSEKTEAELIAEMTVGIMPLPDTPWENGKCGYKLIQYMATGRPTVASPVGVNKKIIKSGISGFLASSHSDWIYNLSTLRDNPALSLQMGLAGRKMAEDTYNTQTQVVILDNLLKTVLS